METSTVLRNVSVVVGLALIASAFVLAFFITPTYVVRLPDDTDAKRSYTGTFTTLLDAQELAKGNLLTAVKHNVPLTIERTIKVQNTSCNTVLVSDGQTTTAAGNTIEKTTWRYAIDRKTLEPATDHPASWTVVDAQGLTVSWPYGAKKQTYTGWQPETRTTTPLTYSRTENKSGITTYVYEAAPPATRITDAAVLGSLPPAVPRSTLALAAQTGTFSAQTKQTLAVLLPTLPDPVPLSYTVESADTFWVEPQTGVVVDTQHSQRRTAGVAPSDGTFLPLLAVSDASYRQTADSVKQAADYAKDGRDTISCLGTTLPLLLGGLGTILVAASLLIPRRNPRGGATPTQPAPSTPSSPTAPHRPPWFCTKNGSVP